MMPRGLSLYLDLVRFAAAVVVVVTHLAYPELSGGQLLAWRAVGNDAVTVFFVLSGLVIAHVTDEKDRTPRAYAVSRLARLWSVALPALALTIFLDQCGRALAPAAYDAWWMQDEGPLRRLFAAATFTNELWFSSIRPFSNGPFWSLSYEAWYYAIFGVWTFTHGRLRAVAIAALLAFVGPKILLMFPAWLLGVVVWRRCTRGPVSPGAGLALLVGSALAYAAYRVSGLPEQLAGGTVAVLGAEAVGRYLSFSDEFLSSLIIGLLVAAHFLGAHALARPIERTLAPMAPAIRWLAGCTFAIYLTHYPMLRFIGAVVPYDPRSPLHVAGVLAATLAGCIAVGLVTEPRKRALAGWLDRALDTYLTRVRPRLVRAEARVLGAREP